MTGRRIKDQKNVLKDKYLIQENISRCKGYFFKQNKDKCTYTKLQALIKKIMKEVPVDECKGVI